MLVPKIINARICSFQISVQDKNKIEEIAREKNISVSKLMRTLVKEHIEEHFKDVK